MYDEETYTDYVLFNGDTSESSPTDASLDDYYDCCYNAFYNALTDYYSSHSVVAGYSFNYASSSDAMEYATSTDSKLYTVSVAHAPTSSAQATETYILDIRNILLIFACTWLAIILYSKLKNLLINYTTKN